MDRYGSLYDSFKVDSIICRSFLIVQQLRRTIFVILLVTLHDEPMIQASTIAALFCVYFAALVLLRPYSGKWTGNGLSIMTEGVITLCSLLFLSFDHENMTKDEQESLGWSIVSFIAVVIIVNVVGILFV
jgi:hypothetical protein